MMMRRTVVSGIAMMLAAASLTLSAYAQSSTAFTYQGFLRDNGQPANGQYDLQFTLYDALTGGNQIGNSVVIDDLQITNGLFTVEIDFGINPFSSGQRRWIEIGIRPFNSTGSFVILDPRIELTPVPYAIYAQKAQDAVNAQNAQNAQNAENAQNAVNAQNAENAQNATRADTADAIQGRTVSNSDPADGDVLKWIDNQWTPAADSQVHKRVRAKLTQNKTIPRNTAYQLSFDVEDYDLKGEFDPNTGIFTASESGFYFVIFSCMADSNVSALWVAEIRKQASGSNNWDRLFADSRTGSLIEATAQAIGFVQLNPGDKLRFDVFQNSSGNIILRADTDWSKVRNFVEIVKLF